MLKLNTSKAISYKDIKELVIIPKHFDLVINYEEINNEYPLDTLIDLFAVDEVTLQKKT